MGLVFGILFGIALIYGTIMTVLWRATEEALEEYKSANPPIDKNGVRKPPRRHVYPPLEVGTAGNYTVRAMIGRTKNSSYKSAMTLTSKVQVVEDFGNEVRVKHVQMHNCEESYESEALRYLNDEHQLINKSNIRWKETDPELILTELELEELLNGGEIDFGSLTIKVDENVTHNEILDVIIKRNG